MDGGGDGDGTRDHRLAVLSREIYPILKSRGIVMSSSSAAYDSMAFPDLIVALLRELVKCKTDYADRVLNSKRRDDVRGAETVPGYADSHVEAGEDDPTIRAVLEETGDIERKAEEIISLLLSSRPTTGGGGAIGSSRL